MTYNKGEKMNSKEWLERIIYLAKLNEPIFSVYYQELNEAKEKIEKDLEILEILKSYMSIETEIFESENNEVVEYEYIAFNNGDLDIENKEEYNKIKEWLQGK